MKKPKEPAGKFSETDGEFEAICRKSREAGRRFLAEEAEFARLHPDIVKEQIEMENAIAKETGGVLVAPPEFWDALKKIKPDSWLWKKDGKPPKNQTMMTNEEKEALAREMQKSAKRIRAWAEPRNPEHAAALEDEIVKETGGWLAAPRTKKHYSAVMKEWKQSAAKIKKSKKNKPSKTTTERKRQSDNKR